MLELRKNAGNILPRVGQGERFVLSHRGRAAARLEPVASERASNAAAEDPFLTIGRRALPSPKGNTRHSQIDRIIYEGK